MASMANRVVTGRYALLSRIGEGSAGVVWRARDQILDRDVAIKEIIFPGTLAAYERRAA